MSPEKRIGSAFDPCRRNRIADDAEDVAAMAYPTRLYVETTTRCNLHCRMCVKQAEGSRIGDADMSPKTFDALSQLFPLVDGIVLNGIGEPLLHPQLVDYVRMARKAMRPEAWIGIQTNGVLLNSETALGLLNAGMTTICLSVDSMNEKTLEDMRRGISGADVPRAFEALRFAKEASQAPGFRLGAECVVLQDTLDDLPETVRFIAEQGADYILVTQAFPYHPETADNAAFGMNSDASIAFMAEWREKAVREKVDLSKYFEIFLGKLEPEESRRIEDFIRRLKRDAAEREIPIHLERLLGDDHTLEQRVEAAFEKALIIAAEFGVELCLPSVMPKGERSCDFIRDGSMFVDVHGEVQPCYFLWHSYDCNPEGRRKPVRHKAFGNVGKTAPLDIWMREEFLEFRKQAAAYEYADCANCGWRPCNLVDDELFEHDCYGYTVPCCDCLWCAGLFKCLG